MELVLAVILLGAAVALVVQPLRHRCDSEPTEQSELTAIEVARDAKYRDLLDAELDFHTGKLSPEDYRDIDRALRGEAVELLHRLDATKKDGPEQ